MSMTQADLMRLLGGVQTPGDFAYGQQQQQTDPNQQRGDMLGMILNQYLSTSPEEQYFQSGGEEVRGYNRPDDLRAYRNDYMDMIMAALKGQSDVYSQRQQADIDAANMAMDTTEFQSQFGDPGAELRYLGQQGYTPEMIVNMYETPEGEDKFAEGVSALDTALGLKDEYGTDLTIHSPGGLERADRRYQAAKQAVQQGVSQEAARLQQTRWGELAPEMRAKEVYLRQQAPDKNVAVNRFGDVFYGDDAEQQLREAGQRPSVAGQRRERTQERKRTERTERMQRRKTGMGTAQTLQAAVPVRGPGGMTFRGSGVGRGPGR